MSRSEISKTNLRVKTGSPTDVFDLASYDSSSSASPSAYAGSDVPDSTADYTKVVDTGHLTLDGFGPYDVSATPILLMDVYCATATAAAVTFSLYVASSNPFGTNRIYNTIGGTVVYGFRVGCQTIAINMDVDLTSEDGTFDNTSFQSIRLNFSAGFTATHYAIFGISE